MAGETAISRTYGFLSTLTTPSVMKEIIDVITPNNPTIYQFMDDEAEEVDGGDGMRVNLFKELHPGTGAGRTDPVTATYMTPVTVAEYNFKFLYEAALFPKQDLILNESAGGNRLESMLAAGMATLVRSMYALLGGSVRGIWTAGVSDETDKTRLTGIPSLVKSVGQASGTTGGVSRSNTFWQNNLTSNITSFATNGRARLANGLLTTKRGGDFANLGLTNQTGFENYLALFTTTTQFRIPVDGDLFDLGVPNIELYGLKAYPDVAAPTNEFRTLNTDFMKLKLLKGNYLSFSPAMEVSGRDDIEIRLRATMALIATSLIHHSVTVGSDTA